MRRQLAGLRILITGASQGIGRALALEAAKRGAHVLAAARSADLLAEAGPGVRR
ncbi:MAG: SDR family NAD(P)-dependent oxidoreductase [Gemmataceae bacterium]